MKKTNLKIGSMYVAKVSGVMTVIRIESTQGNLWHGINLGTQKPCHAFNCRLLIREATPEEVLLCQLGLRHVPERHGFEPCNQLEKP